VQREQEPHVVPQGDDGVRDPVEALVERLARARQFGRDVGPGGPEAADAIRR
jgi:hypothetical protein